MWLYVGASPILCSRGLGGLLSLEPLYPETGRHPRGKATSGVSVTSDSAGCSGQPGPACLSPWKVPVGLSNDNSSGPTGHAPTPTA